MNPFALAPAGARPALGAPRRAASDQEARAADGAARRRACRRAMDKIVTARPAAISIRQNPCTVCDDPRRDPASSSWSRMSPISGRWSGAGAINARYHVLGGTLSPLDGIGPDDLTIDALVSRAHDAAVTEVILALNATVDGQTTAHYITDLLARREREGDAARAWRAGRRRTRLSRRRHALGGDQAADGVLVVPSRASLRASEMPARLQPREQRKPGMPRRADHEKPRPAGRSAI